MQLIEKQVADDYNVPATHQDVAGFFCLKYS